MVYFFQEGIVIVLDVGSNVRGPTENSFYEKGKECVLNIMKRKVINNFLFRFENI